MVLCAKTAIATAVIIIKLVLSSFSLLENDEAKARTLKAEAWTLYAKTKAWTLQGQGLANFKAKYDSQFNAPIANILLAIDMTIAPIS